MGGQEDKTTSQDENEVGAPPFLWRDVKELHAFGFDVVAYNSFNLFTVEAMPKALSRFFEKLELKYYDRFPLRLGFMRRHGSELKIKARLTKVS